MMKKMNGTILLWMLSIILIMGAIIWFFIIAQSTSDIQNPDINTLSELQAQTYEDVTSIFIQSANIIESLAIIREKYGDVMLLSISCESIKDSATWEREYCLEQQQQVKVFMNTPTWAKVIQKMNTDGDYINNFDCDTISVEYGRQECADYKLSIQ